MDGRLPRWGWGWDSPGPAPQIPADHEGVGSKGVRFGLGCNITVEQENGPSADAQCLLDVVIGEHDADAVLYRERSKHVAKAARLLRIHTRERFITDENPRRSGEGARELEAPPLTARQLTGTNIHSILQRDASSEPLHCLPRARCVHARMDDAMIRSEVVAHGEVPEHARRLRNVRNAASSTGPQRKRRHVFAHQLDPSASDVDLAHEGAKERRFSRTGRAEHAEHFAAERGHLETPEDRLVSARDTQTDSTDRGGSRALVYAFGRIIVARSLVRCHGFGTGIDPLTWVAVTRAVASSIVAFSA